MAQITETTWAKRFCRRFEKSAEIPKNSVPHFIYVLCNEISDLINMNIKFNAFHCGPSNALSLLYENILLIEIDVIFVFIIRCIYCITILEICRSFFFVFWLASFEIYGMFDKSSIEKVFFLFIRRLYSEKTRYGSTRKNMTWNIH